MLESFYNVVVMCTSLMKQKPWTKPKMKDRLHVWADLLNSNKLSLFSCIGIPFDNSSLNTLMLIIWASIYPRAQANVYVSVHRRVIRLNILVLSEWFWFAQLLTAQLVNKKRYWIKNKSGKTANSDRKINCKVKLP